MEHKIAVGGVVVALVLSGLAFFSAPSNTVVERVVEKVGANAGPEVYQRMYFYEGFASGGAGTYFATTSSASATFGITDLAENDYLEVTPDVGAVTLTIPATTTAGFANIVANEVGSKRELVVYNATTTTTADSVITFAAGTGIDLQEDEGETVTLNGQEVARLTLMRKNDGDVIAWVEVGQVGD